MDIIILKAILGLIGFGVCWYAEYKPRKELNEMSNLCPQKDILLRITPPIPYFKASIVASPFFLLGYIAGNHEKKFEEISILLFVSGLFFFTAFSIVYWFIRSSKNRLNNYCFNRCNNSQVKFIPGNLNSKPIVFCEPWSKKDSKIITFQKETER